MKYYSTNQQAPAASLEKAVVKGLAEDRGLYMPEQIKKLPDAFFNNIENLSFQNIAGIVAVPDHGRIEPVCISICIYSSIPNKTPGITRAQFSLSKSSLCLFNKCCKCLCISNCNFGEHLSVKCDACLLKAVHKC